MADPVTLLLVGSAALGAVGSFSAGQAEANARTANAKVAEQNSVIAKQQAAEDEKRQRRENLRRMGALTARTDSDDFDLLADSAMEAELDALTIRHQGDLTARGFDIEAEQERTAASNAKTAGFVGAGTSLLKGGTKIAQHRAGS